MPMAPLTCARKSDCCPIVALRVLTSSLFHLSRRRASLADRVKSNKRQRSNSSHSKSERREAKSKQREPAPAPVDSRSPVRKMAKVKHSLSNHSDTATCLSSSLPPIEKLEAMLDELFDAGQGACVRRQKRSSDSSSDEESDDDEEPRATVNG